MSDIKKIDTLSSLNEKASKSIKKRDNMRNKYQKKACNYEKRFRLYPIAYKSSFGEIHVNASIMTIKTLTENDIKITYKFAVDEKNANETLKQFGKIKIKKGRMK